MEPMAPDWRTIGSAPASTAGPGQVSHTARTALSTRHMAGVAGAFLAALVLGATIALLVMPTPGGVLISAHDAGGAQAIDVGGPDAMRILAGLGSAPSPEPRRLVVDVEGAVARPGLVHVPSGGRVGDALELAGGFASSADLAAATAVLNLAQEVTDGLKIVVPAIGDAPISAGPGAPSADDRSAGGLVDLNHATESELDSLPGVGPATIARIVAAREETRFASVDDLRSRGIVGEAAFAKLRDLVTVAR